MWLPTRAQVDSASRHLITVAGTALFILGAQSKGITLDQLKEIIGAGGTVVNDLVVLLGALAPVYALLKASHSASALQQTISVAEAGATVVTTPEIAAATPKLSNIVSSDDKKVVSK